MAMVPLRARTIALEAMVRALMAAAIAMRVIQVWTASSLRALVHAAATASVLRVGACAQSDTGAHYASTHRHALLRVTGTVSADSAVVFVKSTTLGMTADMHSRLPSTVSMSR